MNRRPYLQACTGLAVIGVAGCLGGEEQTFENPVFEPTLADPSIIRVPDDGEPQRSVSPPDDDYEGTFYAYGTEDNWGSESPDDAPLHPYGPIVKSDDLVEWEYVGEAFEEKPDWKESGGIWAPDIAYHDGEFRYYYAYSVWDDPNPGIGVATSETPEGPFKDQGKLFDSDDINVPNSIDPMFLREDGTPYMVWGSWYGIWGVKLTEDGLGVAGDQFRIARAELFEAPYIIKREGYYYFFGSNGHCCNGQDSNYHVVTARAESFEGPYRNRQGNPITERPGTKILEGDPDDSENRTGDGTDDGAATRFIGPGHNSVIQDDAGQDYIVYHAYEEGKYWINDTPRRTLMIEPIVWEDGWPTVGDGTPTSNPRQPDIDG